MVYVCVYVCLCVSCIRCEGACFCYCFASDLFKHARWSELRTQNQIMPSNDALSAPEVNEVINISERMKELLRSKIIRLLDSGGAPVISNVKLADLILNRSSWCRLAFPFYILRGSRCASPSVLESL